MTLFCLTHAGALNSWLFHIGGAAPIGIITPSAEDSFENKGLLLAIASLFPSFYQWHTHLTKFYPLADLILLPRYLFITWAASGLWLSQLSII